MTKFFNWVGRSFQDKDGNTSSRRCTTFSIAILYLFLNILYAVKVADKEYGLYQLGLNAVLLLLLIGVILWQNLKEIPILGKLIGGNNTKTEEQK